MLRELNENEMMLVSGGDAPEMPDPTTPMSTIDSVLASYGIYREGSGNDPANAPGGANYEVIVTGTRVSGNDDASDFGFDHGWGRGNSGPGEALGDAFDNPWSALGWSIDQIGQFLSDNNLWGCFAPIHIGSSCPG